MAASPVFSGRWEHVGVRYSHQPNVEGRDLASLSAERDVAPTDLLLDLALTDDFDTQVATVMRNGDDDEVASLVAHPAAMIGASDAGAHILANTDSCYAVWTLQHWVRERKALTLERAIAKLTGDQARLLGLRDRGLLRTGLAADLVLFDPDAIRTTGVRFVDDQPEGGRRLVTDATGVEMSVVNGVVATRQGTLHRRPLRPTAPAGRLMLRLPEAAGPSDPARSTPGRQPGSVRRTSSIDTSRPDGLRSDLVVDARARDLRTAPDGTAVVESEAVLRARIDGATHQLARIETTPEVPALARAARRVGGPGVPSPGR